MNQLKIESIDHVRVKITNIGDKVVLISYHGVEREIKQGESVIVLKIVMESISAKTIG